MTARRGSDGETDLRTTGTARSGNREADLLASVGENLATLYSDLLRQPLPPRFATLIDRLAAEAAGESGRTDRS